ncbi:hypothetical protein [Nonlabens sp. Hel1_33_55]|uniref:hypothetical protein n=1 Tax=Nonlabens sp. Hel1_33_55 TaxID=1336802 RepID=UPI000AD4F25C|nr:hypothetical protein [Nonlabens sp. Hel1_33_55]
MDSVKGDLIRKGYLNLVAIDTNDGSTNQVEIILNRKYETIIIEEIDSGVKMDSLKVPLSRKRTTLTTPENLEKQLSSIQALRNSQGSPFAEVVVDRWNFTDQDTARVYIKIINSEKRKIDKIVVNGYPKYPENVIRNLMGQSALYNSKNIERLKTRISNLAYLENIKEPQALFKEDSTLLYIYVRKKNINKADGLISFNTDEDGKLRFNGFLDASLVNNFNYGEQFNFEYRNDDNSQTNIDLQLSIPAIILKKIGVAGELTITRRDSLYQNSSLQTGLSYNFLNNFSSQLNYYSKTSVQESNSNSISDFQTRGFSTRLNYIQISNNLLQPESLRVQIGAGIYERQLGNQETFQYTLEAYIEKLWNLSRSINLKSTLNNFLLKTDDLQFNELRQIGGVRTIRGFNQNNIDTAAYSLLQTDVKYAFNDRIYVSVISDGGVFEDFTERKPQYLYSFGAGFGILTNAGILRLEVVNGRFLNSNQGISSTIAHLNFRILF